MKWEREIESRNRPLSDEDLDGMMPTTGYRILDPPPGYAPIMTPARKLMGTPTPMGTPGYVIPEEQRMQQFDVPTELEGLPELKPEDMQHFGKLLKDVSSLVPCTRQYLEHLLVCKLYSTWADANVATRGYSLFARLLALQVKPKH